MKRLLLVALLVTIAATLSGQERAKKVLDLKNGTSVTGYVMEQESGGYMLETEAGDILFYMPEEVLRVRNEDNSEANNNPQQNDSPSLGISKSSSNLLERSGFSLTFSGTKQDLQQGQVSESFWRDYRKASRGKKTGIALLIGGGTTVAVGTILSSVLQQSYSHEEWKGNIKITSYGTYTSPVGMIVAGAGLGVAATGLIIFLSGNGKLKKLATRYNNEHGLSSSFSLGVSPAGFALAYSF